MKNLLCISLLFCFFGSAFAQELSVDKKNNSTKTKKSTKKITNKTKEDSKPKKKSGTQKVIPPLDQIEAKTIQKKLKKIPKLIHQFENPHVYSFITKLIKHASNES